MKRKVIFIIFGVVLGFSIVFALPKKTDPPAPEVQKQLDVPAEIKAIPARSELHDPAAPHKPTTLNTTPILGLYETESEMEAETREYLEQTLIPEEAKYFDYEFGVDEVSGIPYDHIRYNFETQVAEYPGEYTASSKLALYLPFLLKVIQQKPGYDQLENFDVAKAQAHLLQVLSTIETFANEYPHYKGFVPWSNINKAGKLEPLNDFIPALDNGQLTWALAAVSAGLKDSQDPASRKILNKATLILESQNYEEFYDFGSDRLYGILHIDPKTNWWVARDDAYHLMDMYEGSMAVLWAVLHGEASDEAWYKLGAPTVDYVTTDGEKITTIQGFRASFHEFWAVAYLPIMESKLGQLYYNYFHIQADYAKNNSMPGFPTTAYDSRGDYRQMGVPDIAAHDVDRSDVSVLYGTALGVMIAPKTGAKWAQNLHSVEQLRTPLGALESIGYDGVSNVFSSDGKGMTLLASSGGIVEEITEYLKTTLYKDTEMTLYEKLMELLDGKYEQILKQRGKPFYHPTKPVPEPGVFVFEEFYQEKVPTLTDSFDVLEHLQSGHRHGKNVTTVDSAGLDDDIFPGDPLSFDYIIAEDANEENNWAFRGTYMDLEIGIHSAKSIQVRVPNTQQRILFRIEFKRDSAVLAEALVNVLDEGEISADGKSKTLTYPLALFEDASIKALNYVAITINKPAYEGELAELYSKSGQVLIEDLILQV